METRVSQDGNAWSAFVPVDDKGMIREPAGRFLQLRLRFAGTTTATPTVEAIEVARVAG